jgi:hypothetical protein
MRLCDLDFLIVAPAGSVLAGSAAAAEQSSNPVACGFVEACVVGTVGSAAPPRRGWPAVARTGGYYESRGRLSC